MPETITLNKEQFIKFAGHVQKLAQSSYRLADRMSGEPVKKEARALLDDLHSMGALPRDLDEQQKEAAAERIRFDRGRLMDMTRNYAAKAAEYAQKVVSAEVGTPAGEEQGGDNELSEPDKAWMRFANLNVNPD